MADEEPPELMTVKETAEYLRIPLPTVYYLVQRGQLPAIQIGGRWRIKRSLLDRDILKTDEGGQPTVLVVDDDPASSSTSSRRRSIASLIRVRHSSGPTEVWCVARTRIRMGEVGSQSPIAAKSRVSSNTTARSPGWPSWEIRSIDWSKIHGCPRRM